MIVIGLTGDAGSGKSTVARFLAELGAAVVDADQITRELTVPGSSVLTEMVRVFGREILMSNGSLDRSQLAARVFSDPRELTRLNQLLHPPVFAILEERINAARCQGRRVMVLEVPLLLETGRVDLVDEVWVVTADRAVKLARLRARGLTAELAASILDAQMPQEQKIKQAHRIIDNNGSLTSTRQQVINYWTKLYTE